MNKIVLSVLLAAFAAHAARSVRQICALRLSGNEKYALLEEGDYDERAFRLGVRLLLNQAFAPSLERLHRLVLAKTKEGIVESARQLARRAVCVPAGDGHPPAEVPAGIDGMFTGEVTWRRPIPHRLRELSFTAALTPR